MRFTRSVYAPSLGFVAKSMDKGVRAGAVPSKQWHGAGNTVSFALKGFLRGLLTGGVPTWAHRVDMYQIDNRYVAISTSTYIELTICQKTIFTPTFHLGSNYGYFQTKRTKSTAGTDRAEFKTLREGQFDYGVKR